MPKNDVSRETLLKAKVGQLAQRMLDTGLAIESKDAEDFEISPYVVGGGCAHPGIPMQHAGARTTGHSVTPIYIIHRLENNEIYFINGYDTFSREFVEHNDVDGVMNACQEIGMESKFARSQTSTYLTFSGNPEAEENRFDTFNGAIQALTNNYDLRFQGICAYNQAKCALSKYYENDTTNKKENLFRLMDFIRDNLKDINNLSKDTLNSFKKNLSKLEKEVSRLGGEARRCQSASRGARALVNFLRIVRFFISSNRIDAKIDRLANESTAKAIEREKHTHTKQSIQLFQSAINVKNAEKAINTILRKSGV